MRILCISHVFAPVADSEAFCGAKMIKALMDYDVDTKVLTFNNESSKHRARDESSIWKQLTEEVVNVVCPTDTDRGHSILTAIRYRTITWVRWVDSVVNHAIKCHEETPFDIVYSRSLPMISHVAGYWVSQKLKLPWIANINDPWDWHLFPETVKIKASRISRVNSDYWFKKTFHTADLLTFPNKRLCDYHMKMVSSNRSVEIIPHVGYCNQSKRYEEIGFRLVHAGKLGLNEVMGRPSYALLKGLRNFLIEYPDARLVTRLFLVGPRDENTESLIKKLELNKYIISTGRVSYEDSIEYIGSAAVCILIEGKITEGIFLPSKLVDYIAAKKPVLALSPATGIIADMLPCNWLLRVNSDDEIGVARSIANFYEDFRNGSIAGREPHEDVVNQFRPSTVALKFLSALSSIKKKPSLSCGK